MNKISVIVPIYNVEKYLRRCVDSILAQTYANLEVILVDDGSTDGSPAICDEYAQKDKRVVVIHKKNAGVSAARNSGLDKATGDYVAFVDADDYVDTSMYAKLIEKAEQNDLDICVCQYYQVDEQTGKTKFVNETDIDNIKNEKVFSSLIKVGSKHKKDHIETENIMGCVWRAIYKKNLVADTRFNQEFSIGEDLIFSIELFKKKPKVDIVCEPLYFYIQRASSAVHTYSEDKMKRRVAMHKYLLEIIRGYVPEQEHKWHQFHIYASLLNELLKNGQKEYVKRWTDDQYMQSLCSRENYVCAKKLCKVFHYKVAYFFIYHKWFGLYSVILKVL